MRILAIFSLACSIAIFLCNYVLGEALWLPIGLLMAAAAAAAVCLLRRWHRVRIIAGLICGGAAVGLLWTSLYTAIFVQPARELDGHITAMTATVLDFPQKTDYGWSVVVRADTDGPVGVKTLLYMNGQGENLRPGDRIATAAECTMGDRTFSGTKITYYMAKGVFLRGVARGELTVESPDHISVRYWPAWYAHALKQGIDEAFSEEAVPLIRALVTGNRDSLTDEFTTSLERTGLSHMVAVSGMHLAFLCGMVTLLMGRGKRSTAVVSMICVVLFCGVAGNTPSVLRAAIMVGLLQLAPLLGRERDDLTALAFALMVLLLANPFSATHVGLQLSFTAVAGIFLASDKIQGWMLERLHLNTHPDEWSVRLSMKAARFLVKILAATLGASVMVIPLTVIHFKRFSLISPLSNLLTMWAVAGLFLGGLLTGSVAIFQPTAARIMAGLCAPLLTYVQAVIETLAKIPFASVAVVSVYYQIWIGFLCLMLLVLLWGKGRVRLRIPLGVSLVTFAVAVSLTAAAFQRGELMTVVLDVGQGQSVLLRMGNFLSLIDCGGDGPQNPGDTAADYIQSTGRKSLDLLVVSHFHSDHANGIPQLLNRVEVKTMAIPEEDDSSLCREIVALAEEQGIEIWRVGEDTTLTVKGEQTFTLFAPLGQDADTNEQGLTVLATAGDFDVLLTGDMNGAAERLLLEHTALPDIELLVVGHHGSRYSTTEELLAAVQPDAAVISVGAGNRYGHPTQETLDRLASVGAEIYRTDTMGTVSIHGN